MSGWYNSQNKGGKFSLKERNYWKENLFIVVWWVVWPWCYIIYWAKRILRKLHHDLLIFKEPEYNQQWNVFSAFNPSKCTHTWSVGCPGSIWGIGALLTSVVDNSCRSWDSNPQPRVTSLTLYPLEPRLPPKTDDWYLEDPLQTLMTVYIFLYNFTKCNNNNNNNNVIISGFSFCSFQNFSILT